MREEGEEKERKKQKKREREPTLSNASLVSSLKISSFFNSSSYISKSTSGSSAKGLKSFFCSSEKNKSSQVRFSSDFSLSTSFEACLRFIARKPSRAVRNYKKRQSIRIYTFIYRHRKKGIKVFVWNPWKNRKKKQGRKWGYQLVLY